MSDLTTGRVEATPAGLQQPLPVDEKERPVANRETPRETSEVVNDLVAACLDFFYGDQEDDWGPDLYVMCEPGLARRFIPILEAWSGRNAD